MKRAILDKKKEDSRNELYDWFIEPKDSMCPIVEAISCDNRNVVVKINCDGNSIVKLFNLETGQCEKIIKDDRCITRLSRFQNRVVICNYFNDRKDCDVGDTKVGILDLSNNDYKVVDILKKFKAEAIWLYCDKLIVVGTDKDYGLDYVVHPLFQADYLSGKEKKYIREQHKSFFVHSIDSTESDQISNKSEININGGAIVGDTFFFSYVNSKMLYSYDIKTKKKRKFAKLQGKIKALTGNENRVVAYCSNSTFEVYDIQTLQSFTIFNAPEYVNQLIANDFLLFAVYDRSILIYDINTGHKITTIKSPYHLFPLYNFFSAGITVNDKQIIWELGLGKLIIQECPKSLQEMIEEQTIIFEGETIPELERKKYFLEKIQD